MKYPLQFDLLTPSNFRAFRAFAKTVGNKERAAQVVFNAGAATLGLRDPQEAASELRAKIAAQAEESAMLEKALASGAAFRRDLSADLAAARGEAAALLTRAEAAEVELKALKEAVDRQAAAEAEAEKGEAPDGAPSA